MENVIGLHIFNIFLYSCKETWQQAGRHDTGRGAKNSTSWSESIQESFKPGRGRVSNFLQQCHTYFNKGIPSNNVRLWYKHIQTTTCGSQVSVIKVNRKKLIFLYSFPFNYLQALVQLKTGHINKDSFLHFLTFLQRENVT